MADVEAYKVKDLWLELDMMSPVGIPGSYAITVALYDNGEPIQAAGSAVQVQSNYQVHKQMQTPVRQCSAYNNLCNNSIC